MPADLPKHNDPIVFDKGKWVPVGWKPLNTSTKTRQNILHAITKRRSEASDKEAQRNAIRKRKEEKREMKKRAAEEVEKIEQDLVECAKRREELAQLKHEQFAKLKLVVKREADIKKTITHEPAFSQYLNPSYSQAIKQPAVQSNSLISQQFLAPTQPLQQVQNSQIQAILQHMQLQSLQANQNKLPPSTSVSKSTVQSMALPPPQTHTSQIRNQMIPPAAQSPFYSNSNYASPAPSRNYLPANVNSPRRDRPPMASPSSKYPTQPQSRHNSFIGGTRPELVRAAETSNSPAISSVPVTTQLSMAELQALTFRQNMTNYSDIARLIPQHQPTPPPQTGMRR